MILTNGIIELRLIQHYRSRQYDDHDCYYFNICKKGSEQRMGYIELRIGESEYLFFLGNIGYRIDEPYRGNGYAYQACQLVFPILYELEMKIITITCDPGNLPSQKTIEKLKGEFLGVLPIPRSNPLYSRESKKKLVYRFNLEEMYG